MKALDRDLDRIHRGECRNCGWTGNWDEFEDGLCEECWEVAAEADWTIMLGMDVDPEDLVR